MRSMTYTLCEKDYKVRAFKGHYIQGNLAIQLMSDREPFAVITVNLVHELPLPSKEYAFVDTNNCPDAEKFIADNKLGEPVGKYGHSGYCDYPLYKFDLTRLENYDNIDD